MAEAGLMDRITERFSPEKGKGKERVDFEKLGQILEDSVKNATAKLTEHHGKILSVFGLAQVLPKIAKQTSVLALASFLMALTAAPPTGTSVPLGQQNPHQTAAVQMTQDQELAQMQADLAAYKSSPDAQSEKTLQESVTKLTGVDSQAELDGHRLNKINGLIGAEQHLYRYPGDTIEDQLKTQSDYDMYARSGIAPGKGAWGYFAPSKSQMTPDLVEKEKYYFAVQTFLAPEFKTNWKVLREWFKYRKMIAVNTKTGQAVVAVVADAGPAEWTGKSFGGSPEVMHHLGYGGGPRKGEIVILFVDDPGNKIPLGPINLQKSPINYTALNLGK